VLVESGDALVFLSKHRAKFDVVLLDIDAGPFDVNIDDDTSLYSIGGFSSLRASLDKGGRLAIASRTTQSGINKRMRECGFHATAEKIDERYVFTGDL
jgi:predicted membrane-bound spermidine synthase